VTSSTSESEESPIQEELRQDADAEAEPGSVLVSNDSSTRPSVGFKRVSSRLVFWILATTALFQLPLAVFDYVQTRRMVMESTSEKGRNLVELSIARIEAKRASVEKCTTTFSALLNELSPSTDQVLLEKKIQAFVRSNGDIYGSTVAFESGGSIAARERVAPYFYRSEGGLLRVDLADEHYQYWTKDWYVRALKSQGSVWTEPYFDENGGEILMATYSVPFFRNGEVAGVVTADLSLSTLESIIDSDEIGQNNYHFIATRAGRYLFHPSGAHKEERTITELAQDFPKAGLAKAAESIGKGESGFVEASSSAVTGRAGYLAYKTDARSGWAVGVFLDRDDLLSDLSRITWIRVLVGLGGLIVLAVVAIVTCRRITRPLEVLANSTRDIAKGQLNGPMPGVRSEDEVGALTRSFGLMREDLKKHIEELTEATASRQKIESELEVAHRIQIAMVPGNGSVVQSEPEFELAGRLIPAKAVGGDWYDLFRIGEDRLCLVVGDVSDKGVPAALLMAKTVSCIHAAIREVQKPSQILEIANQDFASENESCMFATVFLGILDLETGNLDWASAGHCAPLVRSSTGVTSYLEPRPNLPIGLSHQAAYEEMSSRLEPGDTLVLYSDGVTEAFNPRRELFGEGRLLEVVEGSNFANPEELNSGVLASMSAFAGKAKQSDDITLLTLKFQPSR